MKLTEKGLHAVEEARAKHPDIFEGVAVESDKFTEALSRWAREFPQEAAAYEESLKNPEGVYPTEVLDHWAEIELFAKREYPDSPMEESVKKWIEANPDKVKPKDREGKSGFDSPEIPGGVRD